MPSGGHHLVVGRLAVAVGEDVVVLLSVMPAPIPPTAPSSSRLFIALRSLGTSFTVPRRFLARNDQEPGDRSPCETLETDAASASSILRDASVHVRRCLHAVGIPHPRAPRPAIVFTLQLSWGPHEMPDMRHVGRDQQFDGNGAIPAASASRRRVGQEHFIRSDVNEHRREPGEVPVHRRGQRVFGRFVRETALSQKSGSSSGVPGVTRPFQYEGGSPRMLWVG